MNSMNFSYNPNSIQEIRGVCGPIREILCRSVADAFLAQMLQRLGGGASNWADVGGKRTPIFQIISG